MSDVTVSNNAEANAKQSVVDQETVLCETAECAATTTRPQAEEVNSSENAAGKTTAEDHASNTDSNDNDEDDAGDSDARSRTSTDMYGTHESWKTYEAKVHTLAQSLWPEHRASDIIVDHMKGGSSNRCASIVLHHRKRLPLRIVGRLRQMLTGKPPKPAKSSSYVVRIPRFAKDMKVDIDTALLNYVHELGVPVPTIVKSDATCDSILGKPYVIQTRVPGRTVDYLWDELNHAQRLDIAKQLAHIVIQIASQRSKRCGKVGAKPVATPGSKVSVSSKPDLMDYSFLEKKYSEVEARDLSYWHLPPREMVPATLREWEHYRPGPGSMPWYGLADLAEAMQEKSETFGSDEYWFAHGDLWPRNMLAEVTGPNTARITGMLDWDLSSFAPAVIACMPPTWMWQWDEYCRVDDDRLEEEEMDKIASREPSDAESREIKTCFEKIVGPEYLKYAYHPEGDLARRFYPWVVEATFQAHHIDIAKGFIKGWQEEHEGLPKWDDSDDEYFKDTSDEEDSENSDSDEEEEGAEEKGQEEIEHAGDAASQRQIDQEDSISID